MYITTNQYIYVYIYIYTYVYSPRRPGRRSDKQERDRCSDGNATRGTKNGLLPDEDNPLMMAL